MEEGVWNSASSLICLTCPRSDGVLNPSGVRFGSSEIYKVVEQFPNLVADSLCVGQSVTGTDEEVILFVQTRPGMPFTKEIETVLRNAIAAALSPRHVPKRFYSVTKIPYNANGKKMEIQVKQVCNGGRGVLEKMTLTDAERSMLAGFVRFYDVERVAEGKDREAKL